MKVHGHRGTRGRLPENTVAAFEYAISAAADAIEIDLQVTREGRVVLKHDPASEGEESRLPTLDEALALADRGAFEFNLEIKSYTTGPPPEELATRVLERVRAHGLERRVIVQSFDFRVLKAARVMAPEIRASVLTERDQRPFAEIAADAGGTQMVSPHLSLVTPAKVEAAHAAGLDVIAWTANSPAEWEALAAAGVDAIITDDPAGLGAWRKLEI